MKNYINSFLIPYENEAFISRIRINIPGLHNLSNIMGAILTCRELGLSFEQIINTLPKLSTPKRRFEFLGSWKSRYVFDDYAHHPSEIQATLSMAKSIINSQTNLKIINTLFSLRHQLKKSLLIKLLPKNEKFFFFLKQ